MLGLANEMEGHPDNVAPALFGGFTLAFLDDDGRPVAVRREVHPDIRVVVFSAHQASSTHHTRGLLPAMVPHADASANAAAAGLLVHAMTVDPSFLLPATRDRLHQDYRAPAMPESARLVAELRQAGIAAVISGAGPSVIALVTGRLDARTAGAGRVSRSTEVAVCTAGAQIHSPDLPTRPTAVAQADDVRLLLKAITGCARCDLVYEHVSASRISTVGD